MTRYVEAFSWPKGIQEFLNEIVKERPLLNICSGRTKWGDIKVDLLESADIRQDWSNLDFPNNSFGAVFADPPWDSQYKSQVKSYMEEAIRIAPIVYLMAPWIYGSSQLELTNVWIRQMPGINPIVAVTRYRRKNV